MRKSKTKNKAKTKSSKRNQQYPVHYLAITLIVFLLLQGFLTTATQTSDWLTGLSVLDMHQAIQQVSADFEIVFHPVVDLFDNVNQFYQLAATEMIVLLTDTNPIREMVTVASDIDNFYSQASIQMAKLLDVSEVKLWSAQVAGISI